MNGLQYFQQWESYEMGAARGGSQAGVSHKALAFMGQQFPPNNKLVIIFHPFCSLIGYRGHVILV